MFDSDYFENECSFTQPGLEFRNRSSQHQQSLYNCLNLQSPSLPHSILNQSPLSPEADLSFIQVEFFSTQLQTLEQDPISHQPEGSDALSKLQQPRKNSQGCNNNMTNYILKHCFKQIITEDFKPQISSYCSEQAVTYQEFVNYWKQQLQMHLRKHIGVNYFLKIMREKSPFIQILRYFLIVYLRCDYPMLILGSPKQKKKELYLQSAVKILYLIQLPKDKCHQLIRQAQTGLDH